MHRFRLILSTLVVLAAMLPVTSADAAKPKCFGQRATKVGTGGRDRLVGGPGRDVIVGRGGRDRIVGNGGNDLICSGGGGDNVFGDAGNDKIDLGSGSDFGHGSDGADLVRGGNGDDAAVTGAGNDRISMGAGFDFADPETGDDRYDGGPGLDMVGLLFAPAAVNINLANGTVTGNGNDTLVSVEAAEGTAHDDTIVGTSGTNFIAGGPGSDTIDTGGNAGSLDSPYGIERFEYDYVEQDGSMDHFDPPAPVGNDTVTGGAGFNVLAWGFSEGPVSVDLQTGKASGMGDDTFSGINGVVGSLHTDSLRGSNGADAFDGFGGSDTIDGGNGQDVGVFFDVSELVVDLDTGRATGNVHAFVSAEPGAPPEEEVVPLSYEITDIEDVWGSFTYDDDITGSEAVNELYGLGGDDRLNGGGGNDYLDGAQGNDTADGAGGTDSCIAVESTTSCENPTGAARMQNGRRQGLQAWTGAFAFLRM